MLNWLRAHVSNHRRPHHESGSSEILGLLFGITAASLLVLGLTIQMETIQEEREARQQESFDAFLDARIEEELLDLQRTYQGNAVEVESLIQLQTVSTWNLSGDELGLEDRTWTLPGGYSGCPASVTGQDVRIHLGGATQSPCGQEGYWIEVIQ